MLSALTRYARSFFTSAPVSQEQALAAKETVEVSFQSASEMRPCRIASSVIDD